MQGYTAIARSLYHSKGMNTLDIFAPKPRLQCQRLLTVDYIKARWNTRNGLLFAFTALRRVENYTCDFDRPNAACETVKCFASTCI